MATKKAKKTVKKKSLKKYRVVKKPSYNWKRYGWKRYEGATGLIVDKILFRSVNFWERQFIITFTDGTIAGIGVDKETLEKISSGNWESKKLV